MDKNQKLFKYTFVTVAIFLLIFSSFRDELWFRIFSNIFSAIAILFLLDGLDILKKRRS